MTSRDGSVRPELGLPGDSPQRDRHDPERVDRVAAVIGGMQRDVPVDHVADDVEKESAGQEPEGTSSGRVCLAHEHRCQPDQQDHVTDWISDREHAFQQIRAAGHHRRAQHDVEHDCRAADRDHREVQAEAHPLTKRADGRRRT